MAPREIETLDEFDAVLQGAGEKVVAVDFWATWCGPCRIIGPVFAAKMAEFPQIVFLQVDVDLGDEIAAKYDVKSLPTFAFFKNGEEVDRLVGSKEEELVELLKKHAA